MRAPDLNSIAEEIWDVRSPLKFIGLELGTRMTVIRLSDGSLFLHSPVALDEGLRKALDGLGRVRFVVAPNKFHHLFVAPYFSAYPEARIYAAPGLESKRRDLPFHAVLSDADPGLWSKEIAHLLFEGASGFNEVVFFHKSTRTLVVTDLLMNLKAPGSLLERLVFPVMKMGRGPQPTRVERLLIRDRRAARASIDRILAWDPDRIVMSHGEPVQSGGAAVLRNAFAWL